MIWDGKQLTFETIESIKVYMAARLSGVEKTPPPFFESRGDSPEDVLVQYVRHRGLIDEQCGIFWDAWHDVMAQAYQNRELVTFQNGISLAYQVQPALAQKTALTDFLPRQADQYDWGLVSDHPFQQAILKLFLTWSIIPEGDPFWRAAFRGYLSAANNQGDSRPSLIGAYNGIGPLDKDDYQLMLDHIDRQPSEHTMRQIKAIFADQDHRFDKPGAAVERPRDIFAEVWNARQMQEARRVCEEVPALTAEYNFIVKLGLEKKPPKTISADHVRLYPPMTNPRRDAVHTHYRAAHPC